MGSAEGLDHPEAMHTLDVLGEPLYGESGEICWLADVF
jgi:hypothetical protein